MSSQTLIPPPIDTPINNGGRLAFLWSNWLNKAGLLVHGMVSSGTTAQRPAKGNYSFRPYGDTTLGKPIWRNAANTGWIDATGASV